MSRRPTAATPIAFVRAIAMAYDQRGLDCAAALAAAQIPPSLLDDPQGRITALQLELVSAHAMRELDDEALGWFSRRLPWGSHGLLARAALPSPDLRVALARWCRHHRLLTDDVTLSLHADGVSARLEIELHRPPPSALQREFCLVTLLRNVHGFACWAIDSRIALQEAAFPFDAPAASASAYPLMFPAEQLRFGAPRAGLRFDARYLGEPLRRDDQALRQLLQRPLPLVVRPYRRDRLLAQRVRELLRTRSHATAEAVAAALHLSPRTLHRQLAAEGTSLQALKDAARQALALELLARSDRPVKQVALAAGFRNEKSFSRAFVGWVGVPPGQWRRERQR